MKILNRLFYFILWTSCIAGIIYATNNDRIFCGYITKFGIAISILLAVVIAVLEKKHT